MQSLRGKKIVDRDVINALQKIFEKVENTTITFKEVKESLLSWNDENNCHGLIVFHQLDEIDRTVQVIYGVDSWYKFRRHFLGLYPIDSDFFIDECAKYFPKLYFHERTKATVHDMLKTFSISIVKHLSHLNDVFYEYRKKTFANESEKYRAFSIECDLEQNAASKDSKNAKDALTFEFQNNINQLEKIVCYPHLILCRSDVPGDSHYYYHRLYFHEGIPSIQNGNILIGHIGDHRD